MIRLKVVCHCGQRGCHGAQIEILSPENLRNEFAAEARKMTELYAGS